MQFKTALVTAAAIVAVGCGSGGGSSTPTSSSPPSNPTPVATTTITITAAGVSPSVIIVPVGSRVTYINNDSRSHEMHSDPHPNHGDCPPIDDVGFLASGQTKQTGILNVARTCGYHDHNLPDVANLRGQIIVQ